MAKRSVPRARRRKTVSERPAEEASFPATADHKIVCAKHVIQAVIAAHDCGALEGEDYDIHWPLSLAATLLAQASDQLDKQEVAHKQEVARG